MSKSSTLSAAMYKKLETSGLDKNDAKILGYKFLQREETEKLTKQPLQAMLIPYHDIKGKKVKNFWRLRYLEQKKVASFGQKKEIRYTQPEGASPLFYLAPTIGVSWQDIADDADIRLIITEGELKAACACKHGFATIGVGGVWNWRSKKQRKALIEDFALFKWKAREVILVFDSDLATNQNVQKALYALAKELANLVANVFITFLPQMEDGKTGVDDFIVRYGADEFEVVLEKAEPYDLSKELWQLNTEVAYIQRPGFIVRLDNGQLITPNDFRTHAYSTRRYKEINTQGNWVEKSAADSWLKWPKRFEVDTLDYYPGQPMIYNNQYNQWVGWGCEPVEGPVDVWKELLDNIFQKDKRNRQWFERWCAIQFQQPGVKLYTAVLFWGVTQGTGKSLIGKTLGKIFGENYSEIGNADLHGAYNTWQAQKQFIMIDEIASSDKRERWSDTEKLKKIITQEFILVNEKYIKNYKVRDCVNYYMTSNNPDAIRMDNGDRRFFIKEILSKMEREFYRRYDTWLHGDGPSHLFHYFLNMKLGEFDPKDDAPVTSDKLEMTEVSKTGLALWVHNLIEDPDGFLGSTDLPDLWTAKQLMGLYDPDGRSHLHPNNLITELKKAGVYKLPNSYPCHGTIMRVYALKNVDSWKNATYSQVKSYLEKVYPDTRVAKKKKKAKF